VTKVQKCGPRICMWSGDPSPDWGHCYKTGQPQTTASKKLVNLGLRNGGGSFGPTLTTAFTGNST